MSKCANILDKRSKQFTITGSLNRKFSLACMPDIHMEN